MPVEFSICMEHAYCTLLDPRVYQFDCPSYSKYLQIVKNGFDCQTFDMVLDRTNLVCSDGSISINCKEINIVQDHNVCPI